MKKTNIEVNKIEKFNRWLFLKINVWKYEVYRVHAIVLVAVACWNSFQYTASIELFRILRHIYDEEEVQRKKKRRPLNFHLTSVFPVDQARDDKNITNWTAVHVPSAYSTA